MDAVTTSSAIRGESFRQLWGRPGYPGFVFTVSLSRTAAAMFPTAGVLLVLERTGSAALAGLTVAAAIIPAAVSGPFLGAWLDVADRRRVLMVIDQLLSVIALLALVALAGYAPDWTVPVVTVLYGVTRPFTAGSFFSAMAEIAGTELLDQASAVEATSLNVSIIVGPALAGVLVGIVGAATTIEIQAALTVLIAVLFAINPAFEARAPEQAASVRHALSTGVRALVHDRILFATSCASGLAAFGWGLMFVGFPLYAVDTLGSPAHASGYLWAAVAAGSIIGTFALHAPPRLRRVGVSYCVLGLSALLWPLAGSLPVGIALITLTGFTEGPAYSGTIAIRQRQAPPMLRAQVATTVGGVFQLAAAGGSVVGGAVHDSLALIVCFSVINLAAAAWCMTMDRAL
jgi:MFS family permease